MDEVFRLGWFEDKGLRKRCLEFLAEKSRQYAGAGVLEDDTRSIFVEPVLRGLGWDTLDHEQVDREQPGDRRGGIVGDIHLTHGGRLLAVIEAKPLHDPRIADADEQLRRYVVENLFLAPPGTHNAGMRFEFGGKYFVRGAVTNGELWKVYDFTRGVANPAEDVRLVCEFALQGGVGAEDLLRTLGRRHLLRELGLAPS